MSTDSNLVCKSWYEETYGRLGFAAQRLYPNEELLRFFGRHYFPLPPDQRQKVRVLEAGCGSGANLWMIAREGFDTHGIDLSPEGVALCEKMLAHWGTTATVKAADMTAIPYPDRHFDVVLDVFSAYCLNENGFMRFLDEVVRLLTEVFEGQEFLRRFLSVKNTILNVSSVVWRRKSLLRCLEACRSELSQFRMAADWRLYLECLSAPGAKIAYVADPLNVHRRHAQSVTHSLNADKHVDEIGRMHRVARQRLGNAESLAKQQDAYLEEVRRQLSGADAPVASSGGRKTRARRSKQDA